MKSAGRRGNIGPLAGLVILELTEPADRPAVTRSMLRFFEHTQPADFIILALLILIQISLIFLFIDVFNMQVTYIQKFIMADSEDEFMPIYFAASAAFVAMSQRICNTAKCFTIIYHY